MQLTCLLKGATAENTLVKFQNINMCIGSGHDMFYSVMKTYFHSIFTQLYNSGPNVNPILHSWLRDSG